VLSDDGLFTYYGGACPLPGPLNARAQALVLDAIEVFPPPLGYIGVDLVLGDAEDGSNDYVIEINPRLTTSYVGLRALSKTNLAQAMLDVARGREPGLAWKEGRVRWSADGAVEYLDA
jgi:predicted ATP-grasp superfamily ATP-dependent carboligase